MNDKYNIIKNKLDEGVRDLIEIGRALGSKSEKEKSVKDYARRSINKYSDLKLLYEGKEASFVEVEKIEIEQQEEKATNNYYKDNIPAINNLKSWDDLVIHQKDNIMIQLLNEKLESIEKGNNKKYDIDNNTFILDDKYNNITTDDIATVSLRMTRESKKLLDAFSKEQGHLKKVLLVSQLIEEAINNYK